MNMPLSTDEFLAYLDARPSWHRMNAARRHYRLRNHKAHILNTPDAPSRGTLCGLPRAQVWIDAEHRHNPENKTCARCRAAADKANARTDPRYPNPVRTPPLLDIFGRPTA